jgi:nicotinate-nucleotide adenylyltransferase
MRLGIYGGSFDPVHYGHLILAEVCREACGLDQVWLMPTAVSPLKQHGPRASDAQRLEMLSLAIGGHPGLGICRIEIDRGGTSYTVDTLAELKSQDPARELFFLLGNDSLEIFPEWREPARICELAELVVVDRPPLPGTPPFDPRRLIEVLGEDEVARIESRRVHMPLIGISSSDLRERVGQGRSIRYQTPRAVEMYVEAEGLYRSVL